MPDDPDQDLLRHKGGSAFPYLAFLDENGNVIAKPRGRSVAAFETALDQDVTAWFDLAARAEAGDADATKEFFRKRVEFGHFATELDAARKELAKLDFDDEERTEVEQLLIDQEFNIILGSVTSEAQAAAAGAKVLVMHEAGRVAKGETSIYYWYFLGAYAQDQKKADLLEKVIAGLEAVDDPRAAQLIAQSKKVLAELKGGDGKDG